MYYPALEEVRRFADGGAWVPVWREVVADLETPVSAFLKVNRGGPTFLLESVEGGQRLARYSFIGVGPYPTLRPSSVDDGDPLDHIQRALNRYKVALVPGLPRFCGGLVGYLGYEVVARFEELPSPEEDVLGLPESLFMLVDTMLIFDHVTHSIKVLSHVRPDGDPEVEYERAIDRIEEQIARLHGPLPAGHREGGDRYPAGDVTSNMTREEFEQCVVDAKRYITEGEAIQVVLSQRLTRPTSADPFDIYRALRSVNPSPYMYFVDYGDFQVVGASPEILVRVEEGVVTTRPLAGTRPRGKDDAEDARLEAELKSDEKERAEHIMLVDLGRNDVGRVSEPGSVEVSELMDVERYSHVMHLVTNVQGRVREGLNAFDALRACFPAGTVSGAPKIRAMEIIAGLEPDKRGLYAGAVGYFSFSGNMDMAIAIRTLVVKDGVAYAQAGCGIVYDSVPEREYEETLNKAGALLKAIKQAEQSNVRTGGRHVAAHR
ncbi:MAG: anthranilate synthase component I [Dehalococcoidia bacterium]|nr:anthranilate synthase component I [Dehalococcoidia bacterium]